MDRRIDAYPAPQTPEVDFAEADCETLDAERQLAYSREDSETIAVILGLALRHIRDADDGSPDWFQLSQDCRNNLALLLADYPGALSEIEERYLS